MTTFTRCDIIRAAAAALQGHCPTKSHIPDDPEPGACAVIDRANAANRYFQARYNPRALTSETNRQIRVREMQAYQDAITKNEALIRAKFGENAPVDITWADFGECLQHADGQPGYGNATYFDRNTLSHHLGYAPMPALGAATLLGAHPPGLTNQVPRWVDRFLNPDLAVIVTFVFIVLIVAVLTYSAIQWKKGAPKRAAAAREAEKEKIDAVDPMSGTDFPTSGPPPSAREMIARQYEAQGVNMDQWRKDNGLGPAPKS